MAADWRDFTALLCALLVALGAASLAVSALSITVIEGTILEVGLAVLDGEPGMQPTPTISVLIENDDRVFRIDRGTVVKYAISEADAKRIEVGTKVQLLVSSYSNKVRVIGSGDGPEI